MIFHADRLLRNWLAVNVKSFVLGKNKNNINDSQAPNFDINLLNNGSFLLF